MSDLRIGATPIRVARFAQAVESNSNRGVRGESVDLSPAARSHSHRPSMALLASIGGTMALALGVGIVSPTLAAAAEPTPQVQLNTTETSVQSSANIGGNDANQALNTLSQTTGLKTAGFIFSSRATPASALSALQQQKTVTTTSDLSGGGTDSIQNTWQLAELASVREMPVNSGISTAVGHAFHVLEGGSFGLSQNGQRIDGYKALDAVNHSQPVTVNKAGQSYTISSAQEAVELNALEGDGQNNPLAADTSALLQQMASKTPGAGFAINGQHVGAFGALQALHRGQPLQYTMRGGAFGDTMSRPVGSLTQLPDLQQRVQNQQQKDQYRPSAAEFQQAMGGLTGQLPNLTKDNVATIQGQINAANQRVQGDQQDIAHLAADLKSTSNNQAFNNGALIVSNILNPDPDDTGQLGKALLAGGSAVDQATINDDTAKMARDNADMAGAEQQMIAASSQLNPALQAQSQVLNYQKLVAGATTDATFDAAQPQITVALTTLGNGAVNPSLQQNLQRQGQLMNNMQKPVAPAGWQAPTELFQ